MLYINQRIEVIWPVRRGTVEDDHDLYDNSAAMRLRRLQKLRRSTYL